MKVILKNKAIIFFYAMAIGSAIAHYFTNDYSYIISLAFLAIGSCIWIASILGYGNK